MSNNALEIEVYVIDNDFHPDILHFKTIYFHTTKNTEFVVNSSRKIHISMDIFLLEHIRYYF